MLAFRECEGECLRRARAPSSLIRPHPKYPAAMHRYDCIRKVTEQKEFSRRLTTHVKAGGCASKLSPKLLDRVLSLLPKISNPNVLVGFDTADDAGVYRISDELALVQTVDFFTPVVDDPYTF